MSRHVRFAAPLALMVAITPGADAAPPKAYPFAWSTVVNNGDYMPSDQCEPALPTAFCRTFNSYNQPSVSADRLVVMRARSRGGQGFGEPAHGVYTRDMAVNGPVVNILDRATLVPQPNNRNTVFTEPPSFPRIDIDSPTVATRGNHPPVWEASNENGDSGEPVGTSGIYTNPVGDLITGASKLGGVPAFSFFEVPERPGTPFDVFPGAPAVTDVSTIVFKGNYTVDLVGKTGVYYRDLLKASIPVPGGSLAPAGGTLPVVLIANNTDTLIPGTTTVFGSTAPPSAAGRTAVFAGFDNEAQPTLGGIYLAPLSGAQPKLTTLVRIGGRVPGENKTARFNRLSEGLAFDGRFVAFWGAWGTAAKTLVLQCPSEGSAARRAFCLDQHPGGFTAQVPLHQGIFVHDIATGQTRAVAKAPGDFDDFLFWSFSGRVPGASEGGEDDDGELARWRFNTFVAVSGTVDGSLTDPLFHAAFKARTGKVAGGAYVDPMDGIYLGKGPGSARLATVIASGMSGALFDPEAVDSQTGEPLPVTAMGIERDGFRGNAIVINATMGSAETGWSGIYLTEVLR